MAVKLDQTKSMQQVKNIANKGLTMSNNKVTKDIPLDQIDPHPDNQNIYMLSEIESLMGRIEESGFFGSIEVYLKPDGRYQICSGHRRYEAMKRLGRKTIPCTIYKMEDDITVKKRLIESNLNVRILSPIELSRSIDYYEQILNESGYNGSVNEKLASIFNISQAKLKRLKTVKNLTNELQEFATSLTFPYEAFYEAKNFTMEQQKRLAKLIKEHLNLYPDAELSSVLAKQFIEQVKTEIKIEKERKEREKILSSYQKEVVSNQKQISEAAKPEISTDNFNTPQMVQYQEEVHVIPYGDDTKTEKTNSYVSSPKFEEKEILINEQTGKKDKKEAVSIDFDINLYTAKLTDIISRPNIIISKEVKESGINMLREVISKLEKL